MIDVYRVMYIKGDKIIFERDFISSTRDEAIEAASKFVASLPTVSPYKDAVVKFEYDTLFITPN